MSDFSISQKSFLDELFVKLTNTLNEKTASITKEMTTQISDLKTEIHTKTTAYEKKISELEEANELLQNRITQLQRKERKNNIIIFGIKTTEDPISNLILNVFNNILEVETRESDINDIYRISHRDKNQRPIIVEFISFRKKQEILRNGKKLKGKNIFIAPDLCPEDQINHKILSQHLKQAKSNGLQAYIKGNKIIIGNETFTADQLDATNIHLPQIQEAYKADSAPSTPDPQDRQKRLLTESSLEDEEKQRKQIKKTKPLEKPLNAKVDKNISEKIIKTRSYSSSKGN